MINLILIQYGNFEMIKKQKIYILICSIIIISIPNILFSQVNLQTNNTIVSRLDYINKFHGFWLGQSIANWTGLITEGDRTDAPFYTDNDWSGHLTPIVTGAYSNNATALSYVFVNGNRAWGSDDDTDIEYMYLHLLDEHKSTILTAEQIRDGWLKHIYSNEDAPPYSINMVKENFLWVSNESAYYLMKDHGLLPPETSEPEYNENYDMIDAQLTTEIFGLLAPTRPDIALKMAHLPIRTTAKNEAEWIAEFYVIMHSLASKVDDKLTMQEKTQWLANMARNRLPDDSYPAKMFDFIKNSYDQNPDKDNWELTRDAIYVKYQLGGEDGYQYRSFFDAGINFAASLVSLFYGEGDLPKTIKIGALAGWDSDNPTATWGGLLGFMLGKDGIEQAFSRQNLAEHYRISRTRRNFPDLTPEAPGEDTFTMMSERAITIIDRIVDEEMNGTVDIENETWHIPIPD